jgi:thiamine biosynthesis protein ThiS
MAGMIPPLPDALTLHCRNTSRTRRRTLHNDGMNIELNGQPRTLRADTTVATLLQEEGLAQRRVAVEVNGAIVPRGAHAGHALHDGDRVEIVHALGGG